MRRDSKVANKPASAHWDVREFSPRGRLQGCGSFEKHRSLDTHNQVIADDAGTSSGTF